MKLVCVYTIIVLASVMVALNPLTTKYVLGLSNGWVLWPLIFDLYAAIGIGLAALYLRRGRAVYGAAAVFLLVAAVPFMFCAELAIYHRYLVESARRPTGYLLENVHRSDDVLVWAPIPNGAGRHYSAGNFDVRYSFDSRGRKLIPQNPTVQRTLHVFGDSHTFGHGVPNEQTALALLAERINDRINVLNYAVMGYGLEQDVLRLRSNLDEVRNGDIVLFAPAHTAIVRTMYARSFPCLQHYGGADRVDLYPMFENGQWRYVRLAEECSYVFDRLLMASQLPFGLLRRNYLERTTAEPMFRNADTMFRLARELAASRGATFLVAQPARPNECLDGGRPETEWKGVTAARTSLLRDCPKDPAEAWKYRFPTDGHLSPAGNAWMAESLFAYLREAGVYP